MSSTIRSDAVPAPVRGVAPTDDEAISLVCDLVRTPSVSGSEAAAAMIFVRTAARWGFHAYIDEVGNAVALRRAIIENDSTKEVVLLGHIDTVAGDIPVRVEGGVLHGRGSVDAKGPLCAMLAAAARAHLHESVRVRVVAAVGEETPHSHGARHIASSLRPHACIIGEPSHVDGVTLGYKGRLVMTAKVRRECGHSSGPHGSASDAVLAFWQRCAAKRDALNECRVGAFEQVQSTVQSMSSSSDGLFARATLVVGFRLPRWITPHQLETVFTDLATEHGVTVVFEGHEFAYASDRNDLVSRSLSTAIREEGMRPHPKMKTGTSDMNVVAPVWLCPIAAYGPGDSSLDHTPYEHLSFDEYLRSIRVLTLTMQHVGAGLISSSQDSATSWRCPTSK